MLIPHDTLVAVVDGVTLELFHNQGTETSLRLSPLPTPKLDAHSRDSGKRHRSSTANPDHRPGEEDAFAAAVVAWLNHQAIAGKFAHLVVVAAPRTLGELRRHYHVTLKAKLIGELAKELIGRPAATVEHELKLTHTG
jgi:protein required for attachment to host cells